MNDLIQPGNLRPEALAGLRPYIPPVLHDWAGFEAVPEHEVAALFLDVAGFTQLSEQLAALGGEGAELLERSIADYFDTVLATADRFGGIPIKITGDALTLVFPVHGDPGLAALRAVACAQALRPARGDACSVVTPAGAFPLSHKIGVGIGRLISGRVGDPARRTELVFAGSALEQAVAAEHLAHAGEVWASAGVVDRLEARLRGIVRSEVSTGAAVGLLGPDRCSAAVAGAPTSPPTLYRRIGALPAAALELAVLEARPSRDAGQIEAHHLSLIPANLIAHAQRGTLRYLSRHQPLAVMFASCPELALDTPESLQQLGIHYRHVQQRVEEFGGYLSEFEAGDKGAKLIILFGAPGVIENPCEQAARCARALQASARELGLVTDHRIGLAAGRFYVGRVGCRRFAKFSAIAERMNVAARLMCVAGPWATLAERQVVERSRDAITWSPFRTVKVKGKDEPLMVAELHRVRAATPDRRGRRLTGRRYERSVCVSAVSRAIDGGRGMVLCIRGQPGIGKTRLIEVLRRKARDRGCPPIERDCAGGCQTGPFLAWRPLLLELIGAGPRTTVASRRACFQRWIEGLPDAERASASLLAPVLDLDLPIDPRWACLPHDRLVRARQRTLAELVLRVARNRTFILVLDDAERLDEGSLRLLLELAPRLAGTRMLVALAARTAAPGDADPLSDLIESDAVLTVQLEPLADLEAVGVATARLRVRQLDAALGAFLKERARGNPLLIESWAELLRDEGRLRILDGTACLVDAGTPALPERLEALVMSRFERLPPDARLTLEVASVIGRCVTPAEIAALHPQSIGETRVTAHLRMAARADLLRYDRGNAPRMFFSRPEVLETLHGSLTFQLRRRLHALRIQQLEASAAGEPDGDLAIELAEHHLYVEDFAAQRHHFTRALAVCRDRSDHPGMVRWGRRLIEVLDRLLERPGGLAVAPRLEGALRSLSETSERAAEVGRWVCEAERAVAHE